MMKKGERSLNDRYEGYSADLAKAVCKKLGIHYELKLVDDGMYGEKNRDGTWNGMIGELTRRVRLRVYRWMYRRRNDDALVTGISH